MNKDFTVLIDYLNKNMEHVNQKTYMFFEYTNMLELEIKRMILDVEDAYYKFENGKQKSEWSEESLNGFNKIRHKLLDVANAIARLPKTLHYKGVSCADMKLSEMIAEMIDSASK